MRLNVFVYSILVIVLFFGSIGAAKAVGFWQVSGKLTASGEKVVPNSSNPDDLKGWMTLDDVSKAYSVPVQEIVAAFQLAPDTPGSKQLKELESSTFSTANLRTWLKTRLGQ